MTQLVLSFSPQPGQPRDVTQLNQNFVDIRTAINGNLGDDNLAANGVYETNMATGANGLAKGSFSAYRNAALSLANLGVIVFDAELWDVSGWFDTSTGAFTPQVAGYYRLSARAKPSGTTAGTFRLVLRKSGTAYKRSVGGQEAAAEVPVPCGFSVLVQANGSTDSFDVSMETSLSTPALTVGAADLYFQGELIGRS